MNQGSEQPGSAHRLAETVFEQYGQQLQRYLINCLRDRQTARDLEQEVYLRLLRVPDADLVRNALGYVHRIAAHVVHEYRMRSQKERVTFNSDMADRWAGQGADAAMGPDPLGQHLSTVQQLEDLLRRLPPAWREVFILSRCHGLSREEIAHQMGLSENTVKIYVNRAVAALRAVRWESI